MFKLFENNDLKQIRNELQTNPGLANAGVKLSDKDGKGGHRYTGYAMPSSPKKYRMNRL
ncbi:MAG TPA: hypothetical protein VHA52_07050 [Candidatus Babeliaceae bacterium]|nr:hypothetical protein [Candidatus Babeliaceae bacterium]